MRIHHLAFRSSDVPRVERFYVDVLGLDVLRRDEGRSVWLDAGGAILMLERREPDEPEVDPATKELVCFAVAPGDGARLGARLDEAGVAIEGRTAYTLYFRDPDGRRVGISSYPEPYG